MKIVNCPICNQTLEKVHNGIACFYCKIGNVSRCTIYDQETQAIIFFDNFVLDINFKSKNTYFSRYKVDKHYIFEKFIMINYCDWDFSDIKKLENKILLAINFS